MHIFLVSLEKRNQKKAAGLFGGELSLYELRRLADL